MEELDQLLKMKLKIDNERLFRTNPLSAVVSAAHFTEQAADGLLRPEDKVDVSPLRNFSTIFAPHAKRPELMEILLEHRQTRETTRLSDLLPEGYAFSTANAFACDRRNRIVSFKSAALPCRSFFLKLSHEAGHAEQQPRKLGLGLMERLRYNVHIRLSSLLGNCTLPRWFIDRYHQGAAKDEKEAWDLGCEFLEQAGQRQLNVLAGYQSAQELELDQCTALITHEFRRRIELAVVAGLGDAAFDGKVRNLYLPESFNFGSLVRSLATCLHTNP